MDAAYQKEWRRLHEEHYKAYIRNYMREYRKNGKGRQIYAGRLAKILTSATTTRQMVNEIKKLIPKELLEQEDK